MLVVLAAPALAIMPRMVAGVGILKTTAGTGVAVDRPAPIIPLASAGVLTARTLGFGFAH